MIARPSDASAALLLFSVDVEEPGASTDGQAGPSRLVELTERYLAFLDRHDAKGTFFMVGDIARRHSDLVRRIVDRGHEIGCHSDRHIPLDRMNEAQFRDDTNRSLDSLAKAGAIRVRGYRAPIFSLTAKTRGAYGVLRGLGFDYSSSVLPARNPLYGWPEFGPDPRIVDGIAELPVTMIASWLPVPFGGVYFRALPAFMIRRGAASHRERGAAVRTYLHPYDIDDARPRYLHPETRGKPLFDWLMHRGRSDVMNRLENVVRAGFRIGTYGAYAAAVRAELCNE